MEIHSRSCTCGCHDSLIPEGESRKNFLKKVKEFLKKLLTSTVRNLLKWNSKGNKTRNRD